MNQDFYQQDSVFQTPPQQKNAAYYRAEARSRLKPFWWIAILVTFLATLLGGISGSFEFDLNINDKESQEEIETIQRFAAELGNAMEEGDWVEFLFTVPAVRFFAILGTIAVLTSLAVSVFVSPPVTVGYQRFALELADRNTPEIRVGTLFRFFKEGYWKTIGLKLLYSLIMLATSIPLIVCSIVGFFSCIGALIAALATVETYFLFHILGAIISLIGWVLLGGAISALIAIPISYMYTFAFMIMAEYPTVGILEALRSSRNLMKGRKWKLFCLDISFIGWYLLAAILTFGIGTLAVHPYNQAARAVFYSDIAKRETAKETEFPSLDPDDYNA